MTPVGLYGAVDAKVKVEILVSHLALLATLSTKSQYLSWMVAFVSATYQGSAYAVIRGQIIAMMKTQLFSHQSGEQDDLLMEALLDELLEYAELVTSGTAQELKEVKEPEQFREFFDIDTLEKCVAFMDENPEGEPLLNDQLEAALGTDDLVDGVHPSMNGAFGWTVQAGFKDVQEGFTFGVDTFKSVRHTPYYTHARKVIAMCFSASVLNKALFVAHPWFHKRLFDGIDAKSGVDPVDLLDEILDLSNAVLTVASQCLTEKTMAPLLGRGRQVVEIDREHAWLKGHMDHYSNGLLQLVTKQEGKVVDDAEFFGRVVAHLRYVQNTHKTSVGAERVNLAAKLNDATKWQADATERLARASSRIEPFLIGLKGRTGQGKTVTANTMLKHTLQCNGFPHTQEYLAQVDSSSKFLDNITNKTLGVFIDDMANTKPQFQKNDELMTLIRLKNTSNVAVPKADLADKGRTFYQCRAIVVSTNSDTLHAEETQCEHSATLRRFDVFVTVETREGFERVFPGARDDRPLKMLDPRKLEHGLYTDASMFSFKEWKPLEVNPGSTKTDTGVWVDAVDYEGNPLRRVSYNAAMRYIARKSAEHFLSQQKLQSAYAYDETLPICPHGGTTAPYCPQCRLDDPGMLRRSVIAAGIAADDTPALVADDEVIPPALDVQAGDGRAAVDAAADYMVDTILGGFRNRRRPALSEIVTAAEEDFSDDESDEFAVGSSGSSSDSSVSQNSFQRVASAVSLGVTTARSYTVEVWGRWMHVDMPESEPKLIGLARAMSNGKYAIEEMAILNFDRVALGLSCVAPFIASCTSGIAWALGFGCCSMTLLWISVFLSSTRTLVATARAWISGRIAGETLERLRKRSLDLMSRYMGTLGFIIMLLGAIKAGTSLYGRVSSKKKVPRCPKVDVAAEALGRVQNVEQVLVGNDDPEPNKTVATMAYVGDTACIRHEANWQNCGCDAHAAADEPPEFRSTPISTEVWKELQVQGGATSLHDPFPKENTWERRAINCWYHISDRQKTATREHMLEAIARQQFVMTIHYEASVMKSNCMIVATNYMIAPAHNFLRSDGSWSKIVKIELGSTTPELGPKFVFRVCPEQMLRLPGDMMLVQTNAGGTMPNVLDLIAEGEPVSAIPITELYRDPETYETQQLHYNVVPDRIECSKYQMRYHGFAGVRPKPTHKGLCGALVVAGMRHPKVVAMHTMGNDQLAVSCRIDVKDIKEGIEMLRSTALIRVRVVEQNDTKLFTPTGMEAKAEVGPLSERSVLREAPHGTGLLPFGTLVNEPNVRHKTRLEICPYAPLVEKVCGVERKHAPPVNIGKATVEKMHLTEMAEFGTLPIEDLLLARQDLLDDMLTLGDAMDFWPQLHPLDMKQAAAGVAGMHTLRSMNLSTAGGFPLTGPKRKVMVHEPLEGLPDAMVLNEKMEADLMKVLDKMAVCERPNFVFKASHKDEPSKKAKVRVFHGSPLHLTMVIRMYLLPLLRMFTLAREQSGSAVGIDASSHEWETMVKHSKLYNAIKAVIGDWPHFDTSQEYVELMLVFGVMIEVIEKRGHYSERDICILTTACEELARHIVMMRGDVTQLEGKNASGQAGTVDTNNLNCAIRLRAGFYGEARKQKEFQPVALWEPADAGVSSGGFVLKPGSRAHLKPLLPQLQGRFVDYVRVMHYGDDFYAAVKDSIMGWYNQVTLSAYFAEHGMRLTDDHKLPHTVPSTPWDDVTFLKRSFKYDAEVDAILAPLAMDSIYKSLFVWPKQRELSDEVHLAECLDGAIREMFQHGREVFDERVPPLLEVATITGAIGLMVETPTDFDTLAVMYNNKKLRAKAAVAELTYGSE